MNLPNKEKGAQKLRTYFFITVAFTFLSKIFIFYGDGQIQYFELFVYGWFFYSLYYTLIRGKDFGSIKRTVIIEKLKIGRLFLALLIGAGYISLFASIIFLFLNLKQVFVANLLWALTQIVFELYSLKILYDKDIRVLIMKSPATYLTKETKHGPYT